MPSPASNILTNCMIQRKPDVLIIDDNLDYLDMLKLGLGKQYSISAISSFDEIETLPPDLATDLIISDYHIGLDTADKVLDRLKALFPSFQYKPIIIVSGTIESTSLISHIKPFDFFEKPFTLKNLRTRIEDALSLGIIN